MVAQPFSAPLNDGCVGAVGDLRARQCAMQRDHLHMQDGGARPFGASDSTWREHLASSLDPTHESMNKNIRSTHCKGCVFLRDIGANLSVSA